MKGGGRDEEADLHLRYIFIYHQLNTERGKLAAEFPNTLFAHRVALDNNKILGGNLILCSCFYAACSCGHLLKRREQGETEELEKGVRGKSRESGEV